MRWFLLSLVALGLIGLIGLLTVRAIPAVRSPSAVAPATAIPRPAAATPRPVSTEAAGTVVFQSIGDLERSGAQLKPGQPFVLSIRQAELTDRLRRQLAGDPAVPLRDVTISMRPGQLVLNGKVTAMGLTVEVVATGEPVVENGRARIVVRDVDVGRLPVPAAVKTVVTDTINRNLGPQQFDIPAVVTSVDVGEGQMTIRGRSR